MGTIVALIILIVVGYFMIIELGFPLTDIADIVRYKFSNIMSGSSLTVISIVIGLVVAYFLFIREDK